MTKNKITPQMQGLHALLETKLAELKEMQVNNVKYQHQQGTKEDIYRIKRELKQLENSL
jgi:hypothetical protein|tara:strand:- start:311 stop:487 length:177 start_codon:yes stop_codon:yes gene_type:complete